MSTEFDVMTFNGLLSLEYLNISGNNLKTLQRFDLPKLTYLDISNNEITDIDQSNLVDLPSLSVINITGNKLRRSIKEKLAKNLNMGRVTLMKCTANIRLIVEVHNIATLSQLIVINNNLAVKYPFNCFVRDDQH